MGTIYSLKVGEKVINCETEADRDAIAAAGDFYNDPSARNLTKSEIENMIRVCDAYGLRLLSNYLESHKADAK